LTVADGQSVGVTGPLASPPGTTPASHDSTSAAGVPAAAIAPSSVGSTTLGVGLGPADSGGLDVQAEAVSASETAMMTGEAMRMRVD
jgi:hypothetical protein